MRVWGWTPDWKDGVTERLEWLTEVLASPAGIEQRRALRIAPRRSFQAEFIVSGTDRARLDLALRASATRWLMPVWPDVQRLNIAMQAGALAVPCDTRWRGFHAGGFALLRGGSVAETELVQVEAALDAELRLAAPLTRSWGRGARLYPVRQAELAQEPQWTRLTDMDSAVDAEFLIVEPDDVTPAVPEQSLFGYPILADRPDESEDLTARWQRLLSVLDNETGTPRTTDTAGMAFSVQAHRWVKAGRAEQGRLRALFYALRGRQRALWVPTYAMDLELAAPVGADDAWLDIASAGYAEFEAWKMPGRRQLMVETREGAIFAWVQGAERLDAERDRLLLGQPLGRALAMRDVRRISYLVTCRLDQDAIEFKHTTDTEGHMTCEAQFRATLAPALLLAEDETPLQLEDESNLQLEEIWI